MSIEKENQWTYKTNRSKTVYAVLVTHCLFYDLSDVLININNE